MTSTVKVNNLRKTSESADRDISGVAAAWFKASDAAVVADSINISSSVDNGTGDYQFNFSNNMGNINYAQVSSATAAEISGVKNTTIVVGNCKISTFRRTDTYTAEDTETSCAIHGDLA